MQAALGSFKIGNTLKPIFRSEQCGSMTTLKLQLDWKPNAQFAGILLAHHLGWYERVGINLTIIPWQSHTNPITVLESEEKIIVSVEDNLLIRARAAGKPGKAIGTMLQYSGIGWMALKESGIKDLPDLKGKRLGIHGDDEVALHVALSHFGMTRNELDVVEVGFNYADLLQHGEVDAVQCFVMVEPYELERRGFALEVIPAYKRGYQVYAQVLVTTEKLIATQFDKLVSFLNVTFDGWRRTFQDPAETTRVIVSHYLPASEPDLEKQTLLAIQPFLEGKVGLARLGCMDKDRWEKSINYLLTCGLIDQKILVEEVMTNRLMAEAMTLVEA